MDDMVINDYVNMIVDVFSVTSVITKHPGRDTMVTLLPSDHHSPILPLPTHLVVLLLYSLGSSLVHSSR